MSKEKKEEKVIKPKYEFAKVPDGVLIPASPLKKTISKTMEVTEQFNIFDVMTYIAKLKKAIEDKDAEKEGMISMLKAYEEELALIEEELGVQKMQEEFEKLQAEPTAEEIVEEIINEDEENN